MPACTCMAASVRIREVRSSLNAPHPPREPIVCQLCTDIGGDWEQKLHREPGRGREGERERKKREREREGEGEREREREGERERERERGRERERDSRQTDSIWYNGNALLFYRVQPKG